MLRARPNPWVGLTYIPDNERMEVPPAWFLQQLHDYDVDLVVLPSRQRPFAYVLARRARITRGLTDKAFGDTCDQPDTKMCFKYGLVPVCLFFKHGPTWSADTILQKLMARDTWRMGDALPGTASRGDKIADMLEAQEEREKQKTRDAIRNDMWHRSGDAWRSYQARTGQRVTVGSTQPQSGRRIPNSPPSRSTAGSGTLWVARD